MNMNKDANQQRANKGANILPKLTKPGRRGLKEEDKSSKRITLLLTPSELRCFESNKPHIKVPNGVFLKDYLVSSTDLLNKNEKTNE